MADMLWTKQQSDAIYARTGAILVSAAAGSGKTAVLSQRVTELLTDVEAPVPADRVLVATFSNAAAAEMRERIAAKLSEKAELAPQDAWLARQQLLLESASIGTVHSFCLGLVRNGFQSLDIPPDFRIAEERELALWREDALNSVIEESYAAADPDFIRLSQTLSYGRNDNRLAQAIDRLYDFMRARPFYRDWLCGVLRLYDERDIGASAWGAQIFEYAGAAVSYAFAFLSEAIETVSRDEQMAGAYMGALLSDISQLESVQKQISKRDWDGVFNALSDFKFARLGSLRGYENEELKKYVLDLREKAKKVVEELAKRRFCATISESAADIEQLGVMAKTLFSLSLDLDEEYGRRKRARGAVDFSDLEQMALKLLTVRETDGSISASATAKELAQRYEHILIDEYQDTNEVQELIFNMVSRNGSNMFMVGDVKQSIYRFRQAMPEIFMEKRRSFLEYDGSEHPSRIVLPNNFRSRSEVTDFINFVFLKLMSLELGEVEYNEEERLIASASYPESDTAGVQMHIIEAPGGVTGEEKTALEADYVASLIENLLREGKPVFSDGVMRPVRAGDICILLRSPSKRAALYEKALLARGIGAKADSADGLLSSKEVLMALSLFSCVDNPLLDVELAACMLSPVFAFTPEELARIRIKNRAKSLYACVRMAADEGDEKCFRLLGQLEKLRALAAVLPADRFIRSAYELTGCLDMAGAWENGAQRQANLRLLIEYAASFESGAGRGLPGFLSYIERIKRRGDDLPCAFAGRDSGEFVNIMSIHRSKGLEFPIVFLCDTSKRFNKEELSSNMLIDSKLGFACMLRGTDILNQYTTAPLEACRIRAEREMLSEELRILYVAMTRAREQLIITGLIGNWQRKLTSLSQKAGREENIPSFAAQDSACFADWLLMSLLRHPDAQELRKLAGAKESLYSRDPSHVKIVISQPVQDSAQEKQEDAVRRAAPDAQLIRRIRENISWRYPYEGDTVLPSKLSVTEITHPRQEEMLFTSRPAFLSKQGLTAAQRGTAVHLFLRWADFSAAASDAQAELERLTQKGYLTREQANAVNSDAVSLFLSSPLAKRIAKGSNIRREWSFLTQLGPEKLGGYIPGFSKGKITVQGVADLVFEEQGALVIVDYKTDRVRTMQELKERYSAQLSLYSDILSEQLEMPVRTAIIYSLHLNDEIEL